MQILWSTVQAVVDGVLLGALYALIGMGMALIFGVMRIVNFAHGTFLMVAMYAAYLLFEHYGINPYIGFVAAAALLFVVGVATFQGLLRWVADRSDFMQILLTLGLSLIISNAVLLMFSGDFVQVNLPMRGV